MHFDQRITSVAAVDQGENPIALDPVVDIVQEGMTLPKRACFPKPEPGSWALGEMPVKVLERFGFSSGYHGNRKTRLHYRFVGCVYGRHFPCAPSRLPESTGKISGVERK
jgi:hypothetical protein